MEEIHTYIYISLPSQPTLQHLLQRTKASDDDPWQRSTRDKRILSLFKYPSKSPALFLSLFFVTVFLTRVWFLLLYISTSISSKLFHTFLRLSDLQSYMLPVIRTFETSVSWNKEDPLNYS